MEDDIRQHVDCLGEVLFGDGSIEGGILLIGEGIELATHTLQGVDDLNGITTGCSFEGHVLAEMGHTYLLSCFIACASSYLIATIHHLRGRRQMDDTKTIIEGICIIFRHIRCKSTNYFLFFTLRFSLFTSFSYLCRQNIIKLCEK